MRENRSGFVRVLVGGHGESGIQFNRAIQSRRQVGSTDVSLAEQLNACAVYPNGGYDIPSTYVKKIVDRHGKVLEEHDAPVLQDDSVPDNPSATGEGFHESVSPSAPGHQAAVPESGAAVARRAIDAASAFTMTSMLRDTLREGAATVLNEIVVRPDIAGKAGENNDSTDAWFVGFSPDYTCGVWVGFDDKKSLGHGETGARAAAPIWGYFMREVLKGMPVKELPPPKSTEYRSDTSSSSAK
jgi:penicillin-binding protein 1A